ncbi:MAG TPA: endonuclease/exonuclease/phosphatase family protein [Bacteriovoracaceae bacterium]|nr:endonuclease/exonuclease/phosphatase family protein [Bacteriovoracaceae bacterium]
MRLCLITCNIRFDNPSDGQNAWPHRRSLLSDLLRSYHPLIIATQEGRYDQLKDFETLLGDYQLVDHHRSWIKERMYPSFYLKKNAFEVLSSEDLWLSETPDVAGSLSFESTFPRLMTWVRVQPKDSTKNLLLINTHLDHVRPETRASQTRVLVKEIKRIWNGDCPLILMGDFNEAPTLNVRAIIDEEFKNIQDAWKLFNATEESSHHPFTGTCPEGSRIDWILVDKRARVESCSMHKETVNGSFPTDHFPVICEISI